MKKLILVTSPPACGKTFVSKELAKALQHIVYLDKDTLIPLSNKIFEVANQENNRSSEFFETYVRDAEYVAIIDLALEALDYEEKVLINAPFTREIHDAAYMKKLKMQANERGADLIVIWVDTDEEVCRQRMIDRGSDRDVWKLEHWEEYAATRQFYLPDVLTEEGVLDSLIIFHNSSEEEFEKSMIEIIQDFNNYEN